jgi:hypothetical protein
MPCQRVLAPVIGAGRPQAAETGTARVPLGWSRRRRGHVGAWVRGSLRSRVITMPHSAQLAYPSLPRLSRQRVTLPEEAGMGAVPYRCAHPGLGPQPADTAPSGRVFRTARGGVLQDSAYSAVWQGARAAALTPAQHASPLAGRPYDLRHAAVSLWLNSGVPATEIARHAGHSVAVVLTIYATASTAKPTPPASASPTLSAASTAEMVGNLTFPRRGYYSCLPRLIRLPPHQAPQSEFRSIVQPGRRWVTWPWRLPPGCTVFAKTAMKE